MQKKIVKILAVFFVMGLACNAGYAQNFNSGDQELMSEALEKLDGSPQQAQANDNSAFAEIDDGDQARRDSKRGRSSFSDDINDMRETRHREYRGNMGFRGGSGGRRR